MTQKPILGFIGLGVMGNSMALNLIQAGYQLAVFTRTKGKADELLEKGAIWAESPAELATSCQTILTIIGFPADVEDVYFGKCGIFSGIQAGSTLIDMTTSSPALAQRIYNRAVQSGCTSLDAPVSGGDIGAKNGSLSIMIGGDRSAFEEMLPLFEALGSNIVYQGSAGSGQHCKMCNQIAIASTMIGVCEALAYAKGAGLDPETVLQSISSGAAGSWSLSNLAPRILNGNYDPGFYVKHFIKDLEIAAAESKEMSLKSPGLRLALDLYQKLADDGFENDGTQALFRSFEPGQGRPADGNG